MNSRVMSRDNRSFLGENIPFFNQSCLHQILSETEAHGLTPALKYEMFDIFHNKR